MNISQTSQQPVEQERDGDPIARVIYGIGVVLTAFGAVISGDAKWTMVGVAMIAFCYLFE